MIYRYFGKLTNSIKRFGIRETFRRLKGFFQKHGEPGSYIRGFEKYAYAEKYGYDCEYQNDIDFSSKDTDIKIIAFYLPQYHEITENNEWWGEGFTEWTNVRKGDPRFIGHYQPRVPHDDIGYYDLSSVDTIKKQAEIANRHKIYGFCFYYYWFSGKKLLQKPLDILLTNEDININFCICWANENWTRAWDGKKKDVLIAQEYNANDPARLIDDLKGVFRDKRYIHVDDKPVLIIYNPGEIPKVDEFFNDLRVAARDTDIGEICIWVCQTSDNTADSLGITQHIDAEIEFPPQNWQIAQLGLRGLLPAGSPASVYDYSRVVDVMVQKDTGDSPEPPLYRTCMIGWDNSVRRKDEWTAFHHFTLDAFYRWARHNTEYTRARLHPDNRYMFVNAWNEWGEGTYLEPDSKYGYACINTLSKAICDVPFGGEVIIIGNEPDNAKPINTSIKIAVQVHIYYIDLVDEIIGYLNNIPIEYDCYISTDSFDKKRDINEKFAKNSNAKKIFFEVFDNKGRDTAPFILQMSSVIENYDYICHIHSKKTQGSAYGDAWREYLFKHVLSNPQYVKSLLNLFEDDESVGIIYPPPFTAILEQVRWGGNINLCMDLLVKMGKSVELSSYAAFPPGNMFWARTKAISDMFQLGFSMKDFSKERGQLDATTAHAIERTWVYLARANGYEYRYVQCADVD